MIKDFLTAYWGYLPTTSTPYPAHPKVNAFIGHSGHGKTTILDGLRLVLGDTTFENNRDVGIYVYPSSTWAVIRVAFHNKSASSIRPFEKHGFVQDEVVVCCRVFKKDGGWKKEYYVFDGDFRDIIDLGQNPKAYNQRLKTQEAYTTLLKECLGISEAFRRLMAMNPESVRGMIQLNSNQLFNRIYELKGSKKIHEKYRSAKENLASQEIKCESAEKELKIAEEKFSEYKDKALKFQAYQQDQQQFNEKELKAAKMEYWELLSRMEQLKEQIMDKEVEITGEQDSLMQLDVKVEELTNEINLLEQELNDLEGTYQEALSEQKNLSESIGGLKTQLTNDKKKIDKLTAIHPKNLAELNELLEIAKEEKKSADLSLAQEDAILKSLELKLKNLEKDIPPYPDFVPPFINSLNEAGIEYLMLADAINVKAEQKKWQKAIEAYLGANRYRIIVMEKDYVQAKKIQEKRQYTARVSLPKGELRRVRAQNPKPFPTIRSVIEVSYPEKVGGYIADLDQVYLVDTVEEGHRLQEQGLVSITREGLLQDHEGAIFRKYYNLCCGKLAILAEKEDVEKDLITQREKVRDIREAAQKSKAEVDELEKEINLQEELAQLEDLMEAYTSSLDQLNRLVEEQTGWEQKEKKAKKDKDLLQKNKEEKMEHRGQSTSDRKNKQDRIEELVKNHKQLGKDLAASSRDLEDVKLSLKDQGLPESDFDAIPWEIQTPSFRDEHGQMLLSRDLRKDCVEIKKKIDAFRGQYPDINEHIVTLVKTQEGQVEKLKQQLQQVTEKRDEWSRLCEEALYEFKVHIKDTVKEYIGEFATLADLLKAKANGRLEEVGEDPELWQLHLDIGFDGKELRSISDPRLSSGQRACTSLMLLLAAVSNRREGQIPIMFLDEPKARLDDARGNEVGQLLQVTDVQYFITHQQGESLKTIDWINHAFSCSLCLPGHEFAQPMIFKRMRGA